MYVLIMIVLLNSVGLNMSHLYYEDEISCSKAAVEFQSHKDKEYRLKAFCIKGDS